LVKYCSYREIQLSVKSGGHGATGYCLNSGGVVVDLGSMTSMSKRESDGTLQVGMGARWLQVYELLNSDQGQRMAIGGGCGGGGWDWVGLVLGADTAFSHDRTDSGATTS